MTVSNVNNEQQRELDKLARTIQAPASIAPPTLSKGREQAL